MLFEFNLSDGFYTRTGTQRKDVPFGSYIIYTLEIDPDNIKKYLLSNPDTYNSVEKYTLSIDILSKQYDPDIIRLIIHHIGVLLKTGNAYYKEVVENYFEDFKKIKNVLEEYVVTGKIHIENALIEKQNIQANFIFDPEEEFAFILYDMNDIYSLISVELVNIQNQNIKIKKCENCCRYFIPQKRSDEIYCNRIFRNNRTCKEIGYSEKEKRDPFKKMYTTARKTQHARIRYNSHIPNYKEKYYEPWRISAEKAKDYYSSINDLDGFKKWLNDNKNFMKGEKNNGS